MTSPFRLVADWARATLAPPKAAHAVAKHREDDTRIIAVKVTKRRSDMKRTGAGG